MKNSTIKSILVALVAMFPFSMVYGVVFAIVNPSDKPLTSKSITIQRGALEKIIGKMVEGNYAWLQQEDNEPVFAQLDDLDGDGHWDELFTQLDFGQIERKSFGIKIHKGIAPVKFKTNIRFADFNDPSKEFVTAERLKSKVTEISSKILQLEGPGWENEVVAFRNYFDARNGIDIFGKITNAMVLDSIGLKNGPTYHEMGSWGMDILKVGNSLGAGALAIQSGKDLFRLGENGKGTFNSVVEGPIRSVFDLDFEEVSIDGFVLKVKHRISIEAGKPYYKSEVFIEGAKSVKLVAGLVNLQTESYMKGAVNGFSALYTHDNQAYNGEKLGMAIFVPQRKINVVTAPEVGEGITQTFYFALPVKKQPIVFYFMAGWEKQNQDYSTVEGFRGSLFKEIENVSAKITVSE
jgi:hypothetical protein